MFVKPASPRLQAAHPLANGLVGAWLFMENSGIRATDRSRRAPTNGVGVNAPTWASNMLGPVINMNGTSQYFSLFTNLAPAAVPPSLSNIAAVGGKYSFVAWMKSGSNATDSGTSLWAGGQVIIELRSTGTTGFRGWSFGLEGGRVSHGRANVSTSGQKAVGNTFIGDSVFRQVAATIDTNTIVLYQNGQTDGGGTFGISETTGDCSVAGAGANIYGQIGAKTTDAAAAANWFSGHLDHLLVYNRALSYQEITQLYADPYAAFRQSPRIRRIFKLTAPGTAKQYAVSVCA